MDIEKLFKEFVEKEWHDGHEPQGGYDHYDEDEEVEEARTYLDRKDEKKRKGFTPQSQKKKRWGSGGYGKGEEVEESEEDEAYGGTKKWKKGQNKMKKVGIALHKKDRYSGYVEDAEIEEGYKDLPPHLQKLVKKIEKKQKDWNKQNPEAKIQTLVYNPETGKPDIIVKETTMKLEDTVKQVLDLDEYGKIYANKKKKMIYSKTNETNKNDKSDDGDGLDAVQPKAVKKKFKDRKDKDIDNDGDVDSSDKFLHKKRKAISKAIDKKENVKKETFSKLFSHIKSLMQGK